MQNSINTACEYLSQGKSILYPTDTVWGIGCDATNEQAVQNIYNIKERSDSKSMIILVSNFLMLQEYVPEVPFQAIEIMDEVSEPLTVIYPSAKGLAKNLLASDGSIGIRIPNDEFCKSMISKFGKPIVSTSANISGQAPASCFSTVNPIIVDRVDYVVDYRRDDTRKANPSMIVKVNTDGTITRIR